MYCVEYESIEWPDKNVMISFPQIAVKYNLLSKYLKLWQRNRYSKFLSMFVARVLYVSLFILTYQWRVFFLMPHEIANCCVVLKLWGQLVTIYRLSQYFCVLLCCKPSSYCSDFELLFISSIRPITIAKSLSREVVFFPTSDSQDSSRVLREMSIRKFAIWNDIDSKFWRTDPFWGVWAQTSGAFDI